MDRPAAQFDLGYWIGSAAQRLKALEAGQVALEGELADLRRDLTQARRLALLALLWAGAIGLNVAPEATVALVERVLGLVLKGG